MTVASRDVLKPERYETSIAGWSFALSDALDSYGIDAKRVFYNAGIDLGSVSSPAARLPVSSVQQVWRFAQENTDDYFGIHVSKFLTPASLHALGFALWSSSTLRDFFERYIRYRCVLSHMHFCELIEEENCFTLILVDKRSVRSEITQDAAMGFFLRTARSLYGPEFSPHATHITRSLSSESERLKAFYGQDVKFGCDGYRLVLSKETMNWRLRFANPELAAQQEAIVERYISEHGLISEYMLRVRTEIQHLLSLESVSIERVAEKMNVTVRTLQRRLSDERSSYNVLLDKVRKQLAMEYARNPEVTATEAAFKLGFNDSGSFGRSFKRWTQQSFSDYRSNPRL
jgi:AraC-like DNA-binding protein